MPKFIWMAVEEDGVTTGWLRDPEGRTIGVGMGNSVREAQQDALGTTRNEDARRYLQEILFSHREACSFSTEPATTDSVPTNRARVDGPLG
jgi:hypothetical protein